MKQAGEGQCFDTCYEIKPYGSKIVWLYTCVRQPRFEVFFFSFVMKITITWFLIETRTISEGNSTRWFIHASTSPFDRLQLLCTYIAYIMSTTSVPNDGPAGAPVQPLHNPSQAAQVVVPQAPIGHAPNVAPGLGVKALLAKRLAKGRYVSSVYFYIQLLESKQFKRYCFPHW